MENARLFVERDGKHRSSRAEKIPVLLLTRGSRWFPQTGPVWCEEHWTPPDASFRSAVRIPVGFGAHTVSAETHHPLTRVGQYKDADEPFYRSGVAGEMHHGPGLFRRPMDCKLAGARAGQDGRLR